MFFSNPFSQKLNKYAFLIAMDCIYTFKINEKSRSYLDCIYTFKINEKSRSYLDWKTFLLYKTKKTRKHFWQLKIHFLFFVIKNKKYGILYNIF